MVMMVSRCDLFVDDIIIIKSVFDWGLMTTARSAVNLVFIWLVGLVCCEPTLTAWSKVPYPVTVVPWILLGIPFLSPKDCLPWGQSCNCLESASLESAFTLQF